MEKRKAFTMAEILVAAAIFMVFSAAVFSIYRMGSRMYVSGSWKYNRQKDAERFFEILKERIEQASNVVTVNMGKKDKEAVTTNRTTFVINTHNYELASKTRASGRQYLAQFAVCKPCIKLPNGSILKKGLALCHGLVLIPDEVTGLYNLHLRVERTKDNGEYFNPSGESCVPAESKNTEFQGDPKEFGLFPISHSYVLKDVFKVEITLTSGENEVDTTTGTGSGTGGEDKQIIPKVFSITVYMRNYKHEQTVLEVNCTAKIEGSVGLSE